MPNQRDPSKAQIGGYVKKTLKAKLQELAKKKGISLSEFLETELEEVVGRAEELPKQGKAKPKK